MPGSRRVWAREVSARLGSYNRFMAFERPAPDLIKLQQAWEEWERGEQLPGKVLANLKTAGMAEVLAELLASGWAPGSVPSGD